MYIFNLHQSFLENSQQYVHSSIPLHIGFIFLGPKLYNKYTKFGTLMSEHNLRCNCDVMQPSNGGGRCGDAGREDHVESSYLLAGFPHNQVHSKPVPINLYKP